MKINYNNMIIFFMNKIKNITQKIIICFMFILPISPSLYGFIISYHYCNARTNYKYCGYVLNQVMFAPFYFVFGSIAHNDEDPPRPWGLVFLVALGVAITMVLFWYTAKVVLSSLKARSHPSEE